ncbi:MAG: hypothetical protein GY913_12120 [Proteobacteria bacterium]|nr:hypothetical protein [Pseudomonadota bacterium]MCP4917662.1 hypothetical protein [Pseudomonadota bacterium]
MLLALLLGATWTEPAARYSVALPGAWSWEPEAELFIAGQLARASNGAMGLVVREVELAPVVASSRRVEALDTDAVLSPDRIARLVEQAQEDPLTTVFVGPADGVDAALGRWVYTDTNGFVWWQTFWRVDDGYAQLVAWSPVDDAGAFVAEMQRIEAGIGHDAGPTVLFDAGRSDCAAAQVERAAVVRESQAFEAARGALREEWAASERDADALALAELRALGVLYRMGEQCIHVGARKERACLVHEGPVRDARDAGVQRGAVACLDADPEIAAATRLAVRPFLE